jgi:hypothetical protein
VGHAKTFGFCMHDVSRSLQKIDLILCFQFRVWIQGLLFLCSFKFPFDDIERGKDWPRSKIEEVSCLCEESIHLLDPRQDLQMNKRLFFADSMPHVRTGDELPPMGMWEGSFRTFIVY